MNGTPGQPDAAIAPTNAPESETPPAGTAYAPHGAQVDPRYAAAPAQPRVNDPRRKSPLLACILSIVPGLGQIYVGYYPRGFVNAVVVALIFAVLTSMNFNPLIPLGIVFLIFFWLYNIIDAGRRAAMYNQVLAGGEIPDLPQDFRMPGVGGSIAGGVVIILLGVIILSNTAYDVPLDWLEDWWPVGLVLVGVYLLGKGILERASARE